MANDTIEFRKRIRERIDATALHRTKDLDSALVTTDILKLDVVARKISVSVPSSITVTLEVSIDSNKWVQIDVGTNDEIFTYGEGATDHLVKLVRVTCTAGSGQVTVAAA